MKNTDIHMINSENQTTDFYISFNKAADQFLKIKRTEALSDEVIFILDELDENWDHSCKQEKKGKGNRRYYWHGDKLAFLKHYREDPCSGMDYLEENFNAEFGCPE
jgi:hypothetical protein